MPVVWSPSPAYMERANITRFMHTHGINGYEELVARSIGDIAWFWDAVVRDLSLDFLEPYERVMDTSRGAPWTTWFVGGRTNIADRCVDTWAARTPDAMAVVWESEDGDVRSLTYGELRALTDRVAHGLHALGVGEHDKVGIFLPMAPETVAALMACAKIGATFVPIFSGFGPEAVAARLADAGARVLLTTDGSLRKGRAVPMADVARRAAELAGCVERIVIWPRLNPDASVDHATEVPWTELVATSDRPYKTEPLESEHPLFIGYTSGTTGRPKGAVHVHAGFMVKVASEVAYQVDLHSDEMLHWVTDLGWIMGPWKIVGTLALGATVLLTEGAPTFPGPDRLWATVERHGVTTLGVSPTLVRALIPSGVEPVRAHDLSTLRILASTGEPWNPAAWTWLFREVGGERLPIMNLSGGTEVGACFLSPLPITRLKPTTLRGPALGMDIQVWGPDGQSVGPGEVGELVCRQPWPAMTRGIWGDDERYLDAYWRRWPGVWIQGDWASVDDDGFWFLHGRSDDTLSVAGKRLGPAEVESALATDPGVAESAAVGVPHPVKGEAIWCFVTPTPGALTDRGFAARLTEIVAAHLGRSFAPERVVFVRELPKTRSGKIVRRVIRAVALGEDPGDLSSLDEAVTIDAIREALASEG